jgi:hypothetical protein
MRGNECGAWGSVKAARRRGWPDRRAMPVKAVAKIAAHAENLGQTPPFNYGPNKFGSLGTLSIDKPEL